MSLIDIILIGIGLSMNAATVSVTNGMVYRMGRDKKIMTPVFFGVFQGLMPILGYFAGGIFSQWITRYSGILVFLIFAFLGIRMLQEGFSHKNSEKKEPVSMTYGVLLLQSVATSVDAFAAGIAFYVAESSIWISASVICVTTFFVSLLAVLLGKKFGRLLGNKAEIFGGLILLLLSGKTLWF